MSAITFRIEDELKGKFIKITENIGIDSSTALRLLVKKVVEKPEIIKLDLDEDLLVDFLQIGENSFEEIWGNKDDDIYSKLYTNV